jgi:DNA-binding CsgD family transcriptional regulator
MINVNTSEWALFNFCVAQLLKTLILIKQDEKACINNLDRSNFRIPIKLHLSQQGKKFIVPTRNGQYTLSKREIECIQCLIDGQSAKETGARLFLSQRTVETYLDNIKDKLNCRRKRDIIRMVYSQ